MEIAGAGEPARLTRMARAWSVVRGIISQMFGPIAERS
jgi:hypothetical protein